MDRLFEKFGIQSFFEPTDDVRVQLRELFNYTKTVVARESEINLEVVLLIAALEQQNAAVNLGMWGGKKELAAALGISTNQYLKRAQAGRVLWRFPEFIDLIESGKTYVSHMGTLAPKITKANKDIFLQEIIGMSEKDLRVLAASVNRDGSRNREDEMTFALKLTLTKSQLHILDRAREVLSASGAVPSDEELLVKALVDLLDKRDPLRKAERAVNRIQKKSEGNQAHSVPNELKEKDAARSRSAHSVPNELGETAAIHLSFSHSVSNELNTKTASRSHGYHSVPNTRRTLSASVKRAAILRDQGCCSFPLKSGESCGSRIGIQYDHIKPVAHGGSNDAANIRLLCREHNILAAALKLGTETMARYMT